MSNTIKRLILIGIYFTALAITLILLPPRGQAQQLNVKKVFDINFEGNCEITDLEEFGGKLFAAAGKCPTDGTLRIYVMMHPGCGIWHEVTPVWANSPTEAKFYTFGPYLYLVGGSEPTLERQIGVVRIEPSAMTIESLLLESYSWW